MQTYLNNNNKKSSSSNIHQSSSSSQFRNINQLNNHHKTNNNNHLSSDYTSSQNTPNNIQNTQKISEEIQKCRPCQKFGLDPKRLQIQELFKQRSYRRLYNIVANDQTEPNQVFRPNLIKQLYFLLQITPFIQEKLRDNFLGKIQQWYNSNDHKKIKLAKNFDGILNKNDKQNIKQNNKQKNFFKSNEKNLKNNRPKTGIEWDTNLIPFLRPYTGKIRNNSTTKSKNIDNSHKIDKQRYMYRPDSSKFGLASTMANTNIQTLNQQKQNNKNKNNNIYQDDLQNQDDVQQLYSNININKNTQQLCDIQQQWQRSVDFKKKYRTLHPQQQPTYQKLMNLISNIKITEKSSLHYNHLTNNNNNSNNNNSNNNSNSNNKFQKDNKNLSNTSPFNKSNNLLSSAIKNRNIQSAILVRNTNNAKQLAKQQLKQYYQSKKQQNNQNNEQTNNNNNIISNNQEFQNQNNQNEQSSDNSTDNIQIQKKGIFTNDKRTKQGRKLHNKNRNQRRNANHMYTMLNGVKILRPYTANQTNIINKLNQYSSLQQNKRVIQGSQDQQIADKFRQYVRRKTMMKKQIIRRSQSKRYMDCFKQNVKVIPERSNSLKHGKKYYMKNNIEQQQGVIQILNKQKQNKSFYDFSSHPNIKQQNLQLPYYNTKQYFQNTKNKEIQVCKRKIHKIQIEPQIQNQNQINKLTYQKRLMSQQKFDPLHKTNLQKYNQEMLEQINKIKQRFNGKICVSTQNLYKALYVDAPIPLNQKQNYGYDQNIGDKFMVPDKKYLMVQKQEKKKKRKLRKIQKGKSLEKSKSRR